MSIHQVVVWIVVAVVVLGGGFVLFSRSQDSSMVKDESSMQKESASQEEAMEKGSDASMKKGDSSMEASSSEKDSMMKKDEGSMMQKGSYEPYLQQKLSMAAKGKVVLFFRATWCPTCKALDSDIRANLSNIPAGLTILDVDYDTSAALEQKYGVTYQHTLVQVNADGSLIKKWSGSPTLAALVAQVQ